MELKKKDDFFPRNHIRLLCKIKTITVIWRKKKMIFPSNLMDFLGKIKTITEIVNLTWNVTNRFHRIVSSIDNGREGCNDAEKHGHTNAHYGTHPEFFDHKGPFSVQNFHYVHVRRTLTKAMVERFDAFEEAKMDESGGIPPIFYLGLCHHPIACAEATS